jgi:hypothetical protein
MSNFWAKIKCAIFGHVFLYTYVGNVAEKNLVPTTECLRCGRQFVITDNV